MIDKIRQILLILAPYIGKAISEYVANRKAKPIPLPPGKRLPWKLTVIIMDGSDRREKAEIPVSEAVEFITARTKFDFEVEYIETGISHEYTPYESDMTRYAMMAWNIPDSFINSLPTSNSYLFLYKLFGREAAQAGSALGLDFGLKIGGKARPYCTVATDPRWFINTPNQGFQSWAAQIVAHELINTIQAIVEGPPYNLGHLTGTDGVSGNIHENERLQKLTQGAYELFASNDVL